MYPRQAIPAQSGSMLVIAIFVIVVMSLLGLAMSRMLSASANTIVYEVYGLRALHAARTGIEASIAQVFPVPDVASTCEAQINSNIEFSSVAGFENCDFSASCDAAPYGGGAGTLYLFSSTGTCEVGEISVSRRVEVEARQ